MNTAVFECLLAGLSEILGIAAITAIIAYIRARGVEVIGTTAFRRFLKRILKGFVKKGATRFIPWLGLALLILDIIIALRDCL